MSRMCMSTRAWRSTLASSCYVADLSCLHLVLTWVPTSSFLQVQASSPYLMSLAVDNRRSIESWLP